jgi:large subunit ribosomal protein L23
MMKTAHDIVIAPVITEASMAAIAQKKYTFRVMKNVNKQEIAKAVEELFGVKLQKLTPST